MDEVEFEEIKAAIDEHNTAAVKAIADLQKKVEGTNQTISDLNSKIAAKTIGIGSDNGGLQLKEARAELSTFVRTGKVQASMATDSNPDGGFLIQPTIETELSRLARDVSPMRRISGGVVAGSNTYIKTVSLNGPTASWVGEKDPRTETQGMKLSQIEFPVHELTAMPALTQQLLDDANTDVSVQLEGEIVTAFNEKEGASFVIGDGNKKPIGFLSDLYTKVANVSWEWGKLGFVKSGVAAALSDETHNGVDAIIDLFYSLKSEYRANGTWLMNSQTAATVSKLKNEDGDYIWQQAIQPGLPSSLLGRPVEICEDMPGIDANKFAIAFGDFSRGYLIVDRIGVRVLRDPYTSKPYVLFYTTKRVGGGIQDFAAIKLLKIAA